jgi:predicted DNA-binding WGR domain protein
MRRFEYVGGSSSKFWEIARTGAEVSVTFGRIGTAGQTQVKDLGNEAAAIKHLDTLIAEKVKKGYVELSGGIDPGTVARAAPAANGGIAKERMAE